MQLLAIFAKAFPPPVVWILSFMIDAETEMTGLGLGEIFDVQNTTSLYYTLMYGSDVIPDIREENK